MCDNVSPQSVALVRLDLQLQLGESYWKLEGSSRNKYTKYVREERLQTGTLLWIASVLMTFGVRWPSSQLGHLCLRYSVGGDAVRVSEQWVPIGVKRLNSCHVSCQITISLDSWSQSDTEHLCDATNSEFCPSY